MRRGAWLVVGLWCGSCFGVSDDNPSLRCADAGACPSPLVCHEGFCVRAEGVAADASDAAPAGDAGPRSDAGPRTLDAGQRDAGGAGGDAGLRTLEPGQRDAGGARNGGALPGAPGSGSSPPTVPPQVGPQQLPPQAPPPQAPPPRQVPPQTTPPAPSAEPQGPDAPTGGALIDAGAPRGRPAEDDEARDDDADSDEGPPEARPREDGCRRCRGSEVCREGVCCHEHHIGCEGACVDPRTDREHCGACNIGCASACRDGSCFDDQGRVCVRGRCFP